MRILKPKFGHTVDGVEGLAIVVVQDATSAEVLMVTFTDEATWRQTVEMGLTSLCATLHRKNWTRRGDDSDSLKVVGMLVNCDGDTLIYRVEQQDDNPVCHTGARSCFYRGVVSLHLAHAPQAGLGEQLKYIEMKVHENIRA